MNEQRPRRRRTHSCAHALGTGLLHAAMCSLMIVKVHAKHGSLYPSPNQQGTGDLLEAGQVSDRRKGSRECGAAKCCLRSARALFQVQHPTALPSAFLEVRFASDPLLAPRLLILLINLLLVLSLVVRTPVGRTA